MTIPLEEDGVYTYHVDAAPKMERLKKQPLQSTPSSQPNTGDSTRLDLWLALIGISSVGFCVTLFLGRKRRNKTQ